eukprot:TRINITY_DN3448_c1_g1_i1.p2 TRINITY_DN3448_c1_g1~~TRINITY_DN3448_c1_g1_i1.p2  ORF type:complete len:114 (+),score=0.36 TRINITY_DN3448_c1_g1_i1:98-439(+)
MTVGVAMLNPSPLGGTFPADTGVLCVVSVDGWGGCHRAHPRLYTKIHVDVKFHNLNAAVSAGSGKSSSWIRPLPIRPSFSIALLSDSPGRDTGLCVYFLPAAYPNQGNGSTSL